MSATAYEEIVARLDGMDAAPMRMPMASFRTRMAPPKRTRLEGSMTPREGVRAEGDDREPSGIRGHEGIPRLRERSESNRQGETPSGYRGFGAGVWNRSYVRETRGRRRKETEETSG